MGELIAQALYSGLLQGGSYALIALGLALVFGTMRIINLAHGELVLLSAYIAYTVESKLGLGPIAAIPVALVVVCIASSGVYFIVSRIKKDREINSLILTFGIGSFSPTLSCWCGRPTCAPPAPAGCRKRS
jgi:branched-chain amino acid transport system permease protein